MADPRMKDADLSLERRIELAMERITKGHGAMRVPVEATDPDVVLADCLDVLKSRSAIERQDAAQGVSGEPIGGNGRTQGKQAPAEPDAMQQLGRRAEVGIEPEQRHRGDRLSPDFPPAAAPAELIAEFERIVSGLRRGLTLTLSVEAFKRKLTEPVTPPPEVKRQEPESWMVAYHGGKTKIVAGDVWEDRIYGGRWRVLRMVGNGMYSPSGIGGTPVFACELESGEVPAHYKQYIKPDGTVDFCGDSIAADLARSHGMNNSETGGGK